MAATPSNMVPLGTEAPQFNLPDTVSGQMMSLEQLKSDRATVVIFICNHCPYVKAIRERIVRDTRELMQLGINSVAIMSNDPTDYPEDSFDNMARIAREQGFPFPYLLDESQQVAMAYGAADCIDDKGNVDRAKWNRYREVFATHVVED